MSTAPDRSGPSGATPLLERLDALELEARALEPGPAERAELRRAVESVVENFLSSVGDLPGFVESDDFGARLLESPIREEPMSLDRAMEHLERDVLRPGANPASGAHLAYIPGGPLYHSALGDYLAAVTNKYPALFFTGPGPVRMENLVLRWAADLVGYPADAGGNIASGGSVANLTAVVTAREAHGLRSRDYPRAVVYTTAQAHHCVPKSLRIAGMGEARVHTVPVDERYRMRADALADAIRSDRRNGRIPWLVVATAGTTDTGAVDPLDPIADIAREEGCWFHVDAAYGGFFLLTESGGRLLRGIERSDSVVLDPHKGLFMPWGSGILLVRDVRPLAAAHQAEGAYMQDAVAARHEVSPADVSPELTKPFRALRTWLPLILLGTRPFRAALEEKLLLARYFHEEARAAGFEVGPPPELSVVPFRWAPSGASLERANRINQGIIEGVRRDGRIFLSSTLLDGRFTLRLAVLQFRTHRRIIDLALEILREQRTAVAG